MFLGLAGLGGLGYYFYNAGGSPKVAKNRFESECYSYPTTPHKPPPSFQTRY